eukprot:3018727-Rhodomonas_salina.1
MTQNVTLTSVRDPISCRPPQSTPCRRHPPNGTVQCGAAWYTRMGIQHDARFRIYADGHTFGYTRVGLQ